MIEQASLIVGDGNWAVKSDSLLGYKIIDGKYYPREMTFTRATTGTRVNAAGLVEVVPYNIVSWSEQFDNAYWTKGGSTIVVNNITAPDGTTTADALVEDTSTGFHQVYTTPAGNANTVYTASIYVKPAGRTQISLTFSGGGFGANRTAFFGLIGNGTVDSTQASVTSASIENVGNGWYRCSVVLDLGAGSGNAFFQVMPTVSLSQSYTGNGTVSAYFWGAQLVEGAQPLTYLPTTDRLDIPRIDYSTGSPALLLEPQRTNVNAKSNDFTISSGYWYDYNFNIPIANQGISPDGNNNAWTLPLDSILTTEYGKVIGLTIGDKTAASIWAKGSETAFKLEIQNVTNTDILGSVTVNLNTGAIISGSGTVESYGNGWYRITTVGTSTITNGYPRSGIRNPNSACLIYGFQYEAGSYATSYIPTTTTTVTRNADIISKSDLGTYMSPQNNTIFFDFTTIPGGQNTSFLSFNVSTGNSIQFWYFLIANSINIQLGGIFYDTGILSGKVAIQVNPTNTKMFVNGVLSATAGTTGIVTTLTSSLGSYTNGATMNCKTMQVYNTSLTDAECIALTTL